MTTIEQFPVFNLKFDGNGRLPDPTQQLELLQKLPAGTTDLVLIAHGFRNSELDATGLYTNFLHSFRALLARPEFAALAQRRFAVAAIYWPSQAFKETFGSTASNVQGLDDELLEQEAVRQRLIALRDSEASPEQKPKLQEAIALLPLVKNDPDAQDRFTSLVLSIFDNSEPDPTEGLEAVKAQPGSELLQKIGAFARAATLKDSDDGGALSMDDEGESQGFQSFFGSIFGRIGQFLNFTTWYLMKDRCGTVGAAGVAPLVRLLRQSAGGVKIHLVGHSLGGRLMAAAGKALAKPPVAQVDSMTLLEAAFSHYGFSSRNLENQPGFFRAVIDSKVVKGPCLETYSFQDEVVGTAYSIASRVAGDNAQAIGDANDPFGGIGRNGAQKTPDALSTKLLKVLPTPLTYNLPPGQLVCLDGSGGLIKNHGDVTNPEVVYAFAAAVNAT